MCARISLVQWYILAIVQIRPWPATYCVMDLAGKGSATVQGVDISANQVCDNLHESDDIVHAVAAAETKSDQLPGLRLVFMQQALLSCYKTGLLCCCGPHGRDSIGALATAAKHLDCHCTL
jgi:hypothetical protein